MCAAHVGAAGFRLLSVKCPPPSVAQGPCKPAVGAGAVGGGGGGGGGRAVEGHEALQLLHQVLAAGGAVPGRRVPPAECPRVASCLQHICE